MRMRVKGGEDGGEGEGEGQGHGQVYSSGSESRVVRVRLCSECESSDCHMPSPSHVDTHLWVLALQFFAREEAEHRSQHIHEILEQVDHYNLLPPLVIVEILSKSSLTKLGDVKVIPHPAHTHTHTHTHMHTRTHTHTHTHTHTTHTLLPCRTTLLGNCTQRTMP